MLTNTSFLKDLSIHAIDGEIGQVDHFLFDDETWAIRYFVVNTGDWLTARQVLISPFSILRVDWQAHRLDVALTKSQVEKSPDIDTHLPVSRQHETEFLGYYGYPYYWGGPYLWGPAFYPLGIGAPLPAAAPAPPPHVQNESPDIHLRGSAEVTGYYIEASDGEIGHVDGFVVEDENWSIRYIEVATRNWLPGKKVLLSPEWIDRVSWPDSKVYATLGKEAIESAPEYILSRPITRDYENKLYLHYGRPPYWQGQEERKVCGPPGA